MDFDAQSAAAVGDAGSSGFLGRGGLLVRPNNSAVEHRVFFVGIGGQVLKTTLLYSNLGPADEPSVGVLPIAKALRQIAPGNSGAVAIQYRFDKAAIVMGGRTDMAGQPRQQVLDLL